MTESSAIRHVPKHIAIIMDGNGRWANERGYPRIKGHEKGSDSVKAAVEGCIEAGVSYLTLYAFSSENWKRPQAEVTALMHLLERFLKTRTEEMHKEGICLKAIGRLQDLPPSCSRALQNAIEKTAQNTRITLILALSYGSRDEIVDAVRQIATKTANHTLAPEDISIETIQQHLYTKDFPDPDLLIRTSGELRLSNFLLWQLSYTEFYITEKLWPDFTKQDLLDAIDSFHRRHRRFGGV